MYFLIPDPDQYIDGNKGFEGPRIQVKNLLFPLPPDY